MSTTEGLSEEQRQANKAIYAGKRFYKIMVELLNELYNARQQKVTDEELGLFAALDIEGLIEEAQRIGQVPDWSAESTVPLKNLTYPKGTTGVNL